MCDYFWQRVENDQGDLADIVRPAGGRSGQSGAELPAGDWQLPQEPMAFPPSTTDDFGCPFPSFQDPLLDQLVSSNFLDGPNASAGTVRIGTEGGSGSGSGDGGLVAQKMLVGEDMKRSSNLFSRVLQISPATVKTSPLSPRAIEPAPPIVAGELVKVGGGAAGCPVDHPATGMQISSPRTPGIKRRKSQAKKVVCIPAPAAAGSRPSGEVVPSDLWAWRKYGQKPIKGSPYPRGYYRCSSSKGCSARKQVERSRTDPNMLVITYTSEHNHPWPTQRNALAGSTRSQPAKTSASKSSPHNPKAAMALKEEPKESTSSSSTAFVKEEAGEQEKAIDNDFDQVFHQGYKPMIPESDQPDDFFAQLAELESDTMSLIFSKELMEAKTDEERGNKAPLDQFHMFDWAGNSLGEAKKGL